MKKRGGKPIIIDRLLDPLVIALRYELLIPVDRIAAAFGSSDSLVYARTKGKATELPYPQDDGVLYERRWMLYWKLVSASVDISAAECTDTEPSQWAVETAQMREAMTKEQVERLKELLTQLLEIDDLLQHRFWEQLVAMANDGGVYAVDDIAPHITKREDLEAGLKFMEALFQEIPPKKGRLIAQLHYNYRLLTEQIGTIFNLPQAVVEGTVYQYRKQVRGDLPIESQFPAILLAYAKLVTGVVKPAGLEPDAKAILEGNMLEWLLGNPPVINEALRKAHWVAFLQEVAELHDNLVPNNLDTLTYAFDRFVTRQSLPPTDGQEEVLAGERPEEQGRPTTDEPRFDDGPVDWTDVIVEVFLASTLVLPRMAVLLGRRALARVGSSVGKRLKNIAKVLPW